MAFGTWLKGLVSSIGSAIKKALPIAKKVVETVTPVAQKVGGLIDGKVGSGIQKIGGLAGKFVNNSSNVTQKMLGAGGTGIRHIIPRFK